MNTLTTRLNALQSQITVVDPDPSRDFSQISFLICNLDSPQKKPTDPRREPLIGQFKPLITSMVTDLSKDKMDFTDRVVRLSHTSRSYQIVKAVRQNSICPLTLRKQGRRSALCGNLMVLEVPRKARAWSQLTHQPARRAGKI